MEKEIWKDIPWFIGLYQASSLGNIRSMNYRRKWYIHILKYYINESWYYRISINKKTYLVHRLIWLTFLWYSNLTINHIDGNKLNNRLDNIEYLTRSENIIHAYKLWLLRWRRGIKWKWENHYACKHVVAIDIKTWLEYNFTSIKEASMNTKLHSSTISNCIAWRIKTAWNYYWNYYESNSISRHRNSTWLINTRWII